MSTRKHLAKPDIISARLAATQDEATSGFEPNLSFDRIHGRRAAGRVGAVGYAVLRSQILLAHDQLDAVFTVLLASLETVRREQVAAIHSGTKSQKDGDEAFSEAGKAAHFQGITQLGIAVENLVSLLHALDAYRAGGTDVADAFLAHDLDLIRVLYEKRRRKLAYWEGLIHRPNETDLTAADLTRAEVRAVRDGSRRLAQRMLINFAQIRAYYTPQLHQIYLRYKHGCSLVSPKYSPLLLGETSADPQAVGRAMATGFAVIHQARDGTRLLHIVATGRDHLEATVRTGRAALALANALGWGWAMEIEHPTERTAAVVEPDDLLERNTLRAGMRKWVGADLATMYDLESIFSTVADETRSE